MKRVFARFLNFIKRRNGFESLLSLQNVFTWKMFSFYNKASVNERTVNCFSESTHLIIRLIVSVRITAQFYRKFTTRSSGNKIMATWYITNLHGKMKIFSQRVPSVDIADSCSTEICSHPFTLNYRFENLKVIFNFN